jgi:hypothetical protein
VREKRGPGAMQGLSSDRVRRAAGPSPCAEPLFDRSSSTAEPRLKLRHRALVERRHRPRNAAAPQIPADADAGAAHRVLNEPSCSLGSLADPGSTRPSPAPKTAARNDPPAASGASGEANQQEWALRFYSATSPDRPNRISAYIFNPEGGLGAGAYFQDELTPGEWIHVVASYDPGDADTEGAGVRICKNGVFRLGPPSPGTQFRNAHSLQSCNLFPDVQVHVSLLSWDLMRVGRCRSAARGNSAPPAKEERLPGKLWSSLLLADDRLYLASVEGRPAGCTFRNFGCLAARPHGALTHSPSNFEKNFCLPKVDTKLCPSA